MWQSASFALVGLIGSYLLRRRPARASQVLLLALVAAVTVPAMWGLVRHFELGLFVAEPVRVEAASPTGFAPAAHEMPLVPAPPAEVVEQVHAPAQAPVLAQAVSAPARADIPWRLIVLYGWVAASLILLGRLFIAVVSGVYLLRRARSIGCEQIKRAVRSAKSRLSITGDLRVRSSGSVRSPIIWCWSHPPVLLVPGDSDHRIDWVGVICHELAHCRRKDHLTGLIAELVVCLLPWNLLLWWSKKRMIRFSEQACDDWVVAAGQPRADYAQSLLDFKPQRQVAFAPAVVSSKKTLAGRVRRILKDSCPNPRTGAAWALTVSAVAICLAVGIAFAQTRPAPSTGTIKTRIGRSVVIEQPVFETMMIRGRVLDPNDEPARRVHIIAMPVTSQGARSDKEGHFELPWSPTWIEEGQPVYLLAKAGYPTHEAAFVEVTDPTQPVTIRLEPAARIVGTMTDPDGRQIMEYRTYLSLPTRFKCQAPILIEGKKYAEPKHIFRTVPFGTKYRLTIESEGYQTRQLAIDATDRSRDVIDIGTITLQPQEPTQRAVAVQRANPELAKEFHSIYRLEEGEVFKLVKPPFVLGRQEHFLNGLSIFHANALHNSSYMSILFTWNGKLELGGSALAARQRLDSVLRVMLSIPFHDFSVPEGLNIRMPEGDWIARVDLPVAERLKVLGEIVYAETNRRISFEKRTVERDVIVARGKYEFKPHPNGKYPEDVHLTWDGTFGGWQRAESLAAIFDRIEWQARVQVIDETEPMEKTVITCRRGPIANIGRDPELRSKRLRVLADNLAKTTSLQVEVERRPAEVWFVTETK